MLKARSIWQRRFTTPLVISLAMATGASAFAAGTAGAASGTKASAPGITSNSVTVGLETTLTGPVAAGFTTVEPGFKARVAVQNAEGGVDGRKIKVVMGDDQGTPSGSLSAAQTLVNADQVFAVTTMSVITPLGSEQWLKQNTIPVVGAPITGPEWAPPNNNMFPVQGSVSSKFPTPVWPGKFLKSKGVTKLAVLAYATSPSAVNEGKNFTVSAKKVGIKTVYTNNSYHFTVQGGFQSAIQAMKAKGVNGVYAVFEPQGAIPFLEEASQAGLKLKAAIVPTAAPAATLANPSANAAMQKVWTFQPLQFPEMNTKAMSKFTSALKKYEHQTTPPDENEEYGWVVADLFIKGLQVSGKNPTRASYMKALRKVSKYNGAGLLVSPADMTKSFGTSAVGMGPAPKSCAYVAQYKGTSWHPQSKALCGGLIKGATVGS